MLYGLSKALIGLNVQHDANHGAVSKHAWINEMLGLGADFIGGSKWLWFEQHWTHHAFTNDKDRDPDSFAGEPMLIFNDYPPEDKRKTWMHQFQAFYSLPILSLYWHESLLNGQIWDLKHRGTLAAGLKLESDYIKRSRKYAISLRFIYISTHVVVPLIHNGFTWTKVAQILLLGASGSLVLSGLFILSHNFDQVDRDPTARFLKYSEPVCWFRSQVETSCTYGGAISGYMTGGLNFQIEHHLFPRMNSAWYPYIAPKVREVCKRHGVNYMYYPWVWQNMLSSFRYVHASGMRFSLQGKSK